jgi:hypothetical protein
MKDIQEKRFRRLIISLNFLLLTAIFVSAAAILLGVGEPAIAAIFIALSWWLVFATSALVSEGRSRRLFNRIGADIESLPEIGESA